MDNFLYHYLFIFKISYISRVRHKKYILSTLLIIALPTMTFNSAAIFKFQIFKFVRNEKSL